MQVIDTNIKLHEYLSDREQAGKSIGFVPTMGALHKGHLELISEASDENDRVVCSIFVNPTQFNKPDDLNSYPRVIEKDIELLRAEKCDVVFIPSVEEIYPGNNPVSETFDFEGLDETMEGKFRPGHFQGVATVVKRLFELVNPTRAYFGMKDYQQLVIIHHMTQKLNLPIEIIPCPIVREESGLAMSSRNELLSDVERKQAALLNSILKTVKIRSGFATISEIRKFVNKQFAKNKYIELEYFDIVDMYSLKSLATWAQSNNVIACLAVWIGKVRLIDNIILFS